MTLLGQGRVRLITGAPTDYPAARTACRMPRHTRFRGPDSGRAVTLNPHDSGSSRNERDIRPLRAVLVERATRGWSSRSRGRLTAPAPRSRRWTPGCRPRGSAADRRPRAGPVNDAEGGTSARSEPPRGWPKTAVVVGTSGSTGEPKGVELSAAALPHSARASLDRVVPGPASGGCAACPSRTSQACRCWFGPGRGTEPVVATRRPRAPGRLRLRARVGRPNPAAAAAGTRRWRSPALARYPCVLLGGAAGRRACGPHARRRRRAGGTTYGMTETCGGCVLNGVPLDGVPAEKRDDGRLWISGPVLFSGYRGGPPAPADGWFRTGDLGVLDATGRLAVRGRATTSSTPAGTRSSRARSRRRCRPAGRPGRGGGGATQPGVGRTGRSGGGAGRSGRPAGLELLRLHVRERLPRYAAPSRVVMVDAVPMLPSGKHDIVRLRQELLRREQTEAESVIY